MKYQDKEVSLYTLSNSSGMKVGITNFGARIVTLVVPDSKGNPQDVVLGFDHLADYFPENHLNDFGAAIGRYANRLKNGRIKVDGKPIQLPQNNGPHCLHGGPMGWQYKVYDAEQQGSEKLLLHLVSEDGDNGFPGRVEVEVTYTLSDDNSLTVDYRATTDRTTVINMTNHSYFNLNGDPSVPILNHRLTIDADTYTPIDATFVPRGEKAPVSGTPFDFRSGKPVGLEIGADHEQLRNGHGYDHNWVLNTQGSLNRPCAQLESPTTGIILDLFTTEPGMQVYTGNFLDGSVIGKQGVAYQQRSAICLETQKYPDSPNQQWPESDAYLHKGEIFRSTSRYHFSHR